MNQESNYLIDDHLIVNRKWLKEFTIPNVATVPPTIAKISTIKS